MKKRQFYGANFHSEISYSGEKTNWLCRTLIQLISQNLQLSQGKVFVKATNVFPLPVKMRQLVNVTFNVNNNTCADTDDNTFVL